MNRTTLKSSLPAALLLLTVAGQATAETPMAQQAVVRDVQPAFGARTAELPIIKVQDNGDSVTTEQNFGQTDATATDIIRELAPISGGNPGAPVVIQTPTGSVTTDAERAIDLTVYFAYDSDRLLPEARAQLDALGYALNSPELRPYSFLIAGHTDAAGPASYNLDLSIRRAITVAQYLIEYHGISPNRLVAHGWGESRLSVPSDPGSGANRRVEVSLILPTYGELFVPSYDYVVPTNGGAGGLFHEDHETWVWLPGGGYGLTDPRWRLSRYSLDDFGGAPTRPVRW